jgi:hypothetical protein
MSRRRSFAVVLVVTSGAAVPCVGFRATSFKAKSGAPRFVWTVIFLVELFTPHNKLVLASTTLI